MVLCRSPVASQASFRQMLPDKDITSRPGLSTLTPPGFRPAASVFCLQLCVRHGVEHGHANIVVIHGPLDPLDIAVLLQKFNGIHLSHRVWSDVLT